MMTVDEGEACKLGCETHVVVDSRDRDYAVHPTPSSYEVVLDEPIQDVTQLRLISADVPFSSYLISRHRCRIPFSYNGSSTIVASIENGDYDTNPTDLATQIAASLNNAVMDSTAFSVEYEARLDRFVFLAKKAFELRWQNPDSPSTPMFNDVTGKLLGFPLKTIQSDTDGTILYPHAIRATYRKNFSIDRYLIMRIDTVDIIVSKNTPSHLCFAIVPRSGHCSNITIHDRNPEKKFNPPVPRFTRLRISFWDYDGNVYDFQNQDHRIELRFVSAHNRRG